MYKAIGHCRVSKGDNDEIKNSLKSQKSEIEKFTSRLNIKPDEIKWFIEEEARSAFSDRADWTKFEEAINEACTNPDIKYFIDFSQERFCRNRTRSQIYKNKLRKHNIKLRFASGDVENPDSMEGFVLDCTGEMLAEMYSRKVGSDTLRGCLENAITRDPETGYAYKNGGAAPFWLKAKRVSIGKDKYGDDIRKTIWIENDNIHTATINRKKVTKTIWEWSKYYFIELRLNQQLGYDKARDVLNELGIPAPRGKHWATTCLYEAERSPALIGLGIYNKRQYARNGSGRIKDQSEWVQIENAHPALLTENEFEALQELSKSRRRVKGKLHGCNSNNDKLLTNNPKRFTCKSCGHKIVSSGSLYLCGKYNNNGKKACGSGHFSVPADWLEEKIINDIKGFLNDKALKKTYDDFLKGFNSNSKNNNNTDLLKKALNTKEKEEKDLIKSLTTIASTGNEIAIKAISKELERINTEKEAIEQELEALSKPKLQKIPTFNEFKKQAGIAKALLSPEQLHEKRKAIWLFVEAITLDPQERTVIVKYYSDPLKTLMEKTTNPQDPCNAKMEAFFETSIKLVAETGFEPMTFGL
jgi:site-specific DNA recombinase